MRYFWNKKKAMSQLFSGSQTKKADQQSKDFEEETVKFLFTFRYIPSVASANSLYLKKPRLDSFSYWHSVKDLFRFLNEQPPQ